jgi:hypothetical protein
LIGSYADASPNYFAGHGMKLTPPTFGVWLIAVLLGGAGIAARLGYVPVLAVHAFWLVVAGFVLLVAATVFARL